MERKSHKNGNKQYAASQGPNEADPVVWQNQKKLIPTKWTVVAIASILLVVAASSLYIFNTQRQESTVEDAEADEAALSSHSLEESGDYKKAIAAYDDAVAEASGEQKASLLSSQALIALRNDSLDMAMGYALEADKASTSPESLSLIAAIARKKGDTDMALEYYERSLAAYEALEVRDTTEEQAVEDAIKELKSE